MDNNENKISELEFQLYMKFKGNFERERTSLLEEFNQRFRQLCDRYKYKKEFTEFYGSDGYMSARTLATEEEQAKKEMTRLAVVKHLEDMEKIK